MRICDDNALGCEEVVYICFTVRDLFLFTIGSFRFWIAWMVRKFAVSILDLVCLAIGSFSPAELVVTCVFFENMSTFCGTSPLEVMAMWFSWPPLKVGVGYLAGASCLGISGDIGFYVGWILLFDHLQIFLCQLQSLLLTNCI